MAKNTYYIHCFKCGREFEHTNEAKKYCPECDKQIRRERSRKCMQKKRTKASCEIKTLREIERERRAYNEEHGTYLSYGQYVNMIEGARV